jgi:hypothetical protein
MKCIYPDCRYEAVTVYKGNALCGIHFAAEMHTDIEASQKEAKKGKK